VEKAVKQLLLARLTVGVESLKSVLPEIPTREKLDHVMAWVRDQGCLVGVSIIHLWMNETGNEVTYNGKVLKVK